MTTPRRKLVPFLSGIAAANLTAMGLIWGYISLLASASNTGHPAVNAFVGATYPASVVVIIPALMGLVAAWFWRHEKLTVRETVEYSVVNVSVAIFVSTYWLMEGVICVLIISPLLGGFVLAGARLGRAMLDQYGGRSALHLMPLVLLVVVVDSANPPQHQADVVDTLVINATPAAVWKHVPAFPAIERGLDYPLFRIGLSAPVVTEISAPKVGATRRCVFTENRVFHEKIVEFVEGRKIVFDILEQPRDPEIFDHVQLVRGGMELADNGNGTTTLIGTTTYRLRAFPAWYFEWWAESIGRAVHLRVMEHIKDLAEAR